jgi:protein DEK
MLGDLPRVVFFMDRKDHAETLGLLYRTIYGGAKCKKNELKKNLKKFNGFSFDEKSPEYEKKYDHAIKIFNTTQLKKACELLDIERGGTKGELLDRVFKFLLAPHKSEHEGLPQPAKRKSKGKRTKRSSKKPKATKKEAKEGEEPEEGDEEGEGEDDGSEGSEESGDEEEGKEANDKSMVNEEDSENETDEEIEEELYPKSSSKKGKGKATPQKPAITPAKATTVRAKSPAIEKNTKATPAKKITNGTPSKVAQVEEKKSATPKSRKTKVIKKDEEEEEENSDEDEEVEEKKKEMPKKSTKATKAAVEKPTTPDSKAPAVPSSNKKRSRTEDKTTEKTATAEASKKPKENGHHVTEAEKKTNGSAPLPGSTLKRASPTKTNGTKLDASEEDEVVKPVAKKAKAALNTSNDGPNVNYRY